VTDPRPVGAEPQSPLQDPEAPPPTREPGSEPPAFAHASEAELSRILDFYAVRWEYEPHVFPILWNTDGDVLESFAPDFYLPDLDLYVELTTLRQKLVRKKNRKLRRLRELYPDIRIKLFYARDFRALMLKYGRLALAEELSGTPGQVTPDRSYEELVAGLPGSLGELPATAARSAPDGAAGAEAGAVPSAATRRRRRRRTTLARRAAAPEAAATDR
jgi:hypoxanthine phosphoribosyltransferase